MKRHIARPALLPIALAVGVPMGFLQVSVLGAVPQAAVRGQGKRCVTGAGLHGAAVHL